ncbi:MAG: LLM class flavin-dependent oxidoreductase [Gammaproteobacteria bacterium]|jgi:5,10-methylenetetrahydromethanopterin reductase|nr:LLM class flavin-dependent oxidoreductase [Gammaproteobacteria bacterium]MBT4495025.1 LLM class flavin-dependent oxidoreductase [Gammaproteobacteria bacterium]MBT7369258.1 LLM class flavin-dependent oxidoreductase [Gammaproteobacteria bacterium]
MEYSIALASEVDSWKWVQRAEELGFSSAWFYDTQLLNPDVFICMALAAEKTSRIRLGTGVLVPSNRIEPVAANAFATLNRIAPGRIDFGVGTGFTARRTMGLGAIPLARTRTYIERVQSMMRGEIVEWDFEGKKRKIGFLNPDLGLINTEDEIPLWVSAFGPRGQQMTAELRAGWLNFGSGPAAIDSLNQMQQAWNDQGHDARELRSVLFCMGAVLTGDSDTDNAKLMAQGGPNTAVIFHNLTDEVGPMGGLVPDGPLKEVQEAYLEVHANYEPADAKYLSNHRGHLMFVRPEETHITPELVRATTLSGTHSELVEQLTAMKEAGYSQITVQLVHGHEHAIEDWAKVFKDV